MQAQQQEMQQHQIQMMQNSPQAQLTRAQVNREQAQTQKLVNDTQLDMFKAQTERQKSHSQAINDHIGQVSDATKVEMENQNTQAQQKLEMLKTFMSHFFDKRPSDEELRL